jgi:pantetheine-phosphate adenylyltransferase
MPSTETRIAVCPGSYDPVTCGHLDVISRAAKVFDELIVAVVNASVRKSKALFSAEERVSMIEESTAGLGNVRVATFDVLIVDFARSVGATSIVKGLRAISDFEYEFEMNQLNRKLAPDINTVYLMAGAQYSFLSSSGVKEMATFGGDVTDLVPGPVASRLKEALDRRSRAD